MKKYEAMFIVKPEMSEDERKNLFNQINDMIIKNQGNIINSGIWAEKRKLYFTIKKHREGVYYIVNFTIAPDAIAKIRHNYGMNEDILRVLFTAL